MKSKYELIIDGLKGIPITGLVEGWQFTIEEIAPYVFKAHGRGPNWLVLTGHGGSASDALDDCVKKANRLRVRENRRLTTEKKLLEISEIITKFFKRSN